MNENDQHLYLAKILSERLEILIKNGVKMIQTDREMGMDLWSIVTFLELKERYSEAQISLILVG